MFFFRVGIGYVQKNRSYKKIIHEQDPYPEFSLPNPDPKTFPGRIISLFEAGYEHLPNRSRSRPDSYTQLRTDVRSVAGKIVFIPRFVLFLILFRNKIKIK